MPVGDLLPEIAVVVAAVAALFLSSLLSQRRQSACAWVALAGFAVAAVACAQQLGTPARLEFAGTWAIDKASVWARLILLSAAAVAVLTAPDWLQGDRRHGEFYVMVSLATLGAMLMAGAAELLLLVTGVLLSSIAGYTLAAWHRDWALSVEAGMKYFLLGAFANTLLVTGVVLLFGLAGDTGFAAMPAAFETPDALGILALTLVIVGVGFKLAAVPAHAWLPDVAQGAPAPAAAFLTVVPKIGALLALARLLSVCPDTSGWRSVIAALAVATMTLGNLAALWQSDLRRLLGWSAVSQSGYALMAVLIMGRDTHALPALLFFLAGYAAANLAAFAVVTHLRGRTAIDDYRGLATQRPWTTGVLALSLLSLVGVPPLAGFLGKFSLFVAAIDAGYAWLAVFAVINTIISLFYYLRALAPAAFRTSAVPIEQLGGWAAAAILVSGVFVIGLGVGGEWLIAMLQGAVVLASISPG